MSATNAVVRIVPAAEGRLSPRTVRLGPDGGTVAWVNPEVVFHRVISDDGAPVTFDVSVAAGFESKAVAFPPGDYTASYHFASFSDGVALPFPGTVIVGAGG